MIRDTIHLESHPVGMVDAQTSQSTSYLTKNEILRKQNFVGVLPSIAKFKGGHNALCAKN